VRAFPRAVGIAVRNKARLEGGLDEFAQRMMHDAVAERRGADLAPLRLVDEKVAVGAGAVRLGTQFAL
jgi:hypothetical protein